MMGDPVLSTLPSIGLSLFVARLGWNEPVIMVKEDWRFLINHEKLTEIYFTIEDDDWDY
jgi:hypothetical protein